MNDLKQAIQVAIDAINDVRQEVAQQSADWLVDPTEDIHTELLRLREAAQEPQDDAESINRLLTNILSRKSAEQLKKDHYWQFTVERLSAKHPTYLTELQEATVMCANRQLIAELCENAGKRRNQKILK